jgi:endonuclease YncB( thermonuclease family)
MRRLVVLCLLSLLLGSMAIQPMAAQGTASCANYDAWEWAQSVFEADPEQYDALDPDNDGTACPDLPKGGFAPAIWTDAIPEDVETVELVNQVDGDTYDVLLGGVTNRVRILRADTPETQNEQHCGGQQATDFAAWALSFNDHGSTVYLERDANRVDRYGRELAYIWFEVDGHPYMLSELLIRSGYAEDVDYGDRLYDDELQEALQFARRHDLGVWGLCGGFGLPAVSAPADTDSGGSDRGDGGDNYAPEPTEAPADTGGNCDPNYTPCVPNVSYDLDCPDIGFSVTVIGSDPHGFDREGDGRGCESY